MTQILSAGTFTAFPYYEINQTQFEALENDEMGRVLVTPEDPTVVHSDVWKATVDKTTGREIEMRRADCGAGCRCAVEVRTTF